jgi:virginiamycin B lyase
LPTGSGGILPGPVGITSGPDRALWFTEYWANNIGRITPAGKLSLYPVPTAFCGANYIAAGPDGALWFTELAGGKIGRITTAGVVTEYAIPTGQSSPGGITAGSDGALWFTESAGNNIGRITTSGVFTEYTLPTASTSPIDIASGSDGALWFTGGIAGQIGRITPQGSITQYSVPTTYNLVGIAAGPDGALWSTSTGANLIVRTTTAGQSTTYPVPSSLTSPASITAGPDGALWFTTSSEIGRITTSGAITAYPVPPPIGTIQNVPTQITPGPDGELWFTSSANGIQIGEVVIASASLAVNPSSGHYNTSITFSGSGFSPNETVDVYLEGVGSTVLASANADSTGAFTAPVTAPQSPMGQRVFLALGQTSRRLGAVNFTTSPLLVLTPASGAAGATVKVQGWGFNYPGLESIFWNNLKFSLGEAITNAFGTFSTAVTFTVPAGSKSGQNTVIDHDVNTLKNVTAVFTVQ